MQPGTGLCVDHINGDPLDNRRSNLRVCTHAQNLQNKRKAKHGRALFKGLAWRADIQKWQVSVARGGKRYHLGFFLDQGAAARAYDKKALELFGEFAKLNFPII